MAELSAARWRVTSVGEDATMEIAADDLAPSQGTRNSSVRPLERTEEQRALGQLRFEVVVDGWRFELIAERADRARLRERAHRTSSAGTAGAVTGVRAQIPGRVVTVSVAPGDIVERGQRLLSVEAMKMENEILAPRAGTITRVDVEPGDRIELGDELVTIG